MELLDRITQSITAKGRLLSQLASLTGRLQGLVDRLERHAESCAYPQMKLKIEDVTAATKIHAKILNGILSDNRVWAKLPGAARSQWYQQLGAHQRRPSHPGHGSMSI